MVNVCCLYFKSDWINPKWKFNYRYDFSWVEKLYNMCFRNINQPFKFYCLTNQNFNHKNIIKLNIDNTQPSTYDKIQLFKSNIIQDLPTVYFDLDIVILNNIDELFNIDNLTMVSKFSRHRYAAETSPNNGSVIGWLPSKYHWIYEEYKNRKDLPKTDDEFISPHSSTYSKEKIVCYTANSKNLLWWEKPYSFDNNHLIVCFNKHTMKQDYYQEESPWIKDYWY